MITKIDPPLAVVTPSGKGLAHFVIDYGYEYNLEWVVFLDLNGECWCYKNADIRIQRNITHGRDYISPFYDPNDNCLKPKGACC